MKYVISSSVIQILCLCLLREEVPDASAFAFHADPFKKNKFHADPVEDHFAIRLNHQSSLSRQMQEQDLRLRGKAGARRGFHATSCSAVSASTHAFCFGSLAASATSLLAGLGLNQPHFFPQPFSKSMHNMRVRPSKIWL